MKILLATGIFPPQIGGPATYAKLLSDELPRRGIDVEVASFSDYLDKPKVVRHFLYFRELFRKAQGVDLVYALDPVSVGLPALLASQIRAKKLVLRVPGDYAWEQGAQRFGVRETLDEFVRGRGKHPWQARLLKWVQAYVAEGAAKVITPSKYLKSIVVDCGVDPRKVAVVYNGFHIDAGRTLRPSLRKKLGFYGSIVVTAGRLVPWKGIKELIEALPQVIEEVPDAELVVIGDGPQGEELRARTKELGLEKSVRFTGRLGQRDLFDYVRAADVFALNTGYEGQSHQILETMALGTPVITTAVGGNPETIEDGQTGILLKWNDKAGFARAIVEVLRDRSYAQSLARAAKKSVARFSDQAMLESVVRELTNL